LNSPRPQAKRAPRARRPLARLGAALIALSALGFVPGATAPALAASCSVDLRDGGGYLYGVAVRVSNPPLISDVYGVVNEGIGPGGANDSWDNWGSVFLASPGADPTGLTVADKYLGPVDGCAMAQSGQEIRYPAVAMKGLEVQRSWFADPGPLNGARLLTVLRNPGVEPISVTLVQGDPLDPEGIPNRGDLGSDNSTVVAATSDGTGIATPAARWGVTTDNDLLPGTDSEDPTLAHVWDGPGGAARISEVVLKTGNDTLYWTRDVTVPPGATASFVSYEIQSEVPGRLTIAEVPQAVALAEARQTQSPASLYRGMSAMEIAGTMNWAHPVPTAAIKPVASANSATPVRLDGTGSVAAAGLPQCGISSYTWKVDDRAAGSGPTFDGFLAPGRHKATLAVTSSCGGSASAETSFRVASGLRLGKVKLNRSKGTATVKVKALGAGQLTLSGKGVKRVTKKLAKPGTATLLVKPTGKVRKLLFARGEAKAKIVVSLKPKSGPATSLRRTQPLKLGD